jgi:hypothetical protein
MENGHQTATQKKIMVHHNPGKLHNSLQYKEISSCAIVAQERKLFKLRIIIYFKKCSRMSPAYTQYAVFFLNFVIMGE